MSIEENMIDLLGASEDPTTDGLTVQYRQTGPREVTYTAWIGRNDISKFSISYLPGCRNVLIFHGVTVDPSYRNQGYGKSLHAYRLRVAERLNSKTVMCTVLVGNSVEKKILSGFGWVCTVSVTPGIEIWTKQLR